MHKQLLSFSILIFINLYSFVWVCFDKISPGTQITQVG